MIEFSNEEIESLESNVDFISYEGSVTINGTYGNDIFSRTYKCGIGLNTVDYMTIEKQEAYARQTVNKRLSYVVDQGRKHKLER